jgi:signal transduction histidine kinase
VESTKPDAFSTADRELLSALASQAALALENARHYAEERRRAEEMTILNELARRISASLDLQVTLEAVVAAAAELILCNLAEVSLWNEGSQLLTLLALHCDPDRSYPVGRSFPPGEGYTGWIVRHREPLLVPDVDARHDIHPHLLPDEKPFRAYAGVPLLLGETLVGTLVLVANQPGAFDQRDMRLLQTLAHHAVTAIHNAQLFDETQRLARRLAALNAVAAVINQPLPLQEMMDRALATVIEVMDTDAGGIRLYDPATGEMVVAAFQGLEAEELERTQRLNLGEGYGERLAQFREPLVLGDLKQVPQLADVASYGFGPHAYAPVIVKGKTVGVLGVITRQQRAFNSEELDLLAAIGNQIGVAIENDHLHQMALETERLAAVGRVATSVAHDLRSPLGGILRSAEFLARPELSPDTRQKLSQSVISLARRLIHTTQGILDFVRREKLPLRRVPCRLSEFLDEVLPVLNVDFSDRGIEVVRQCDYQGEVVMDADRMAQVMYNIATNARDAMPSGGTFTVAARQSGDWVELRFSDTGPGVPEELRERVFEPFFTYGKREGAGLGLSIARRIVEEHGGQLRVESSEEGGATFLLLLPL